METFTIFSIGDSAFLEQILIAVSMITGSRDFSAMISVGLLIGFIAICFQSLFQGAKELNFHQVFICWGIYACFFVPTSTVTIEDAYNGQVRVVANVPIGVGAAGGIISNIGYTITNLFEQGYGIIVPNITENHFSETLKLLNDTRRRAYDNGVFTALNGANGGGYVDIRRSWNNYIRECTLTKVDLNLMSLDELMTRPTDSALRFLSSLYGTRLYLNPSNPDGQDLTCQNAWLAISNATANLNSPAVVNTLNNILGIDTSTGHSALTKISDSLQAIGATSTSSIAYLKAAILEPLYYEAAAGRYQDLQDFGSALMINQALQQRNMQWAAEQSMFMTVVRPMLTFFEGFIYAITPIMAFIMVLGTFGIKLAGKYVQTVIWIQLWMPVLSIINLFIHTAASNEMASYSTAGLNSMYALSSSGDVLQHWIATGGMLAAATPMISLFIVSGSSYAFTNIASRINGSDHIDEKMQSPDIHKQGALVDSQPAYGFNQLTGMAATGAEKLMGSIGFGSNISDSVSSTEQRMSQAMQSFSTSLGQSFSSGEMTQDTYNKMSQLGQSHSASFGTSNGLVNQRSQAIMSQAGIDNKHTNAVKGIVSAVASGSISASIGKGMISQLSKQADLGSSEGGSTSVPAVQGDTQKASPASVPTKKQASLGKNASIGASIGLDGKLSASANKEATDSATSQSSQTSSWSDQLNFTEQQSSQITSNLASSISNSKGDSFSEFSKSESNESFTQQAQDVVSANRAYSTASQFSSQFGASNNHSMKDVAAMVSGNKGAMGDLNSFWSTSPNEGMKEEASGLYTRYKSYGLSNEQALAASRLTAMTNSSHFSGGKGDLQDSALKTAASVIGKGLGRSILTTGSPTENQGLTGADPNEAKEAVLNNTTNTKTSVEAARNQVKPDGEFISTTTKPTEYSSSPQVQGAYDSNSQLLMGNGRDLEQSRYAANEESAWNSLVQNGPEYDRMSAADLYGSIDNAAGWAERRGTELSNLADRSGKAIEEGASVTASEFSEKLEMLKNNPEARQAVIAAAKQSDEELKDSGVAGQIMSGLKGAGRAIIGASATAMELANGTMTYDDIANSSIQEKGLIYEAALSQAIESGKSSALEEFNSGIGEDLRQDFYDYARSQNLTHEQSNIYKTSFDEPLLGQTQERTEAIESLKSTYSSDESYKADHLVDTITESARAGKEMSGSYMTGIQNYNLSTGRVRQVIPAEQPDNLSDNQEPAQLQQSLNPQQKHESIRIV